jgi:hypothetical protein
METAKAKKLAELGAMGSACRETGTKGGRLQ